MEEELLVTLQAKWEAKLLETRVADFARANPSPPSDDEYPKRHPESTPPSGLGPPHLNQLGLPYVYSAPHSRQNSHNNNPTHPSASSSFNTNSNNNNRYSNPVYGSTGPYDGGRPKPEPGLGDDVLRLRGGAGHDEDVKPRIQELSSAASGSGSQPQPNAAGLLPGDDIIDSDLDDSDDGRDDGEGGEDEGEIDIVFCVYDKVQRVKNKWKTVFKDGMIHINGRDYLFTKCTGEFEW